MLAASFYKKYTSLSKPNIQNYSIDSLNFFKSGFWQKQRFTTYLLVFVRSIHQFNCTNDTSIQRHGRQMDVETISAYRVMLRLSLN